MVPSALIGAAAALLGSLRAAVIRVAHPDRTVGARARGVALVRVYSGGRVSRCVQILSGFVLSGLYWLFVCSRGGEKRVEEVS